MERNLSSNHHYRLNEDSPLNKDGKIYIFVKLTDSCLKTIENSIQQNKRSLNQLKANIQFHHHGGEISIPTNNGEKRKYSFQLAPEDKTSEVFECLRQVNRNELQSCSTIDQRINIQAQEDVYSMTKHRVTEFQKQEELTKKQTKEIGESTKTILEKKTKKTSNQPRSTTTTTTTTMNSNKSLSSRLSKINEIEHSSPTNSSHQSSILDRPLKERLIHFLAVRKYRRPDLLLQLKYGEMKDEDKEQLNHYLSTLTTQSKSGEYILSKQFYLNGDINPDWPFYSKNDSILVKKKIHDLQSISHRSNLNSSNTKIVDTNIDRSRPSITNSIKTNPRPTTTNEQISNEILTKKSSEENSTNEEKFHQLSDMFDKLTNQIQFNEQTNRHRIYFNEKGEQIDEKNFDEIEREYNRLVPEYNHLIDYLEKISQRFSSFEEDFRLEQTNDKATKIVDEFFQCEHSDGFLHKRQRALQLNQQLEYFKSLLEKDSIKADWDQIDISDDDDDEDDHHGHAHAHAHGHDDQHQQQDDLIDHLNDDDDDDRI